MGGGRDPQMAWLEAGDGGGDPRRTELEADEGGRGRDPTQTEVPWYGWSRARRPHGDL